MAKFQDCPRCQNEPCKDLQEAIQELETLSSVIISPFNTQSSLKKLSSLRRLDLLRCESEELLSKSTMALNYINNCHNSIEEVDKEDEDYEARSGTSSYHSSASHTNLDLDFDDHQAVLAKSLEELQHKLNRMEQELIIVGEESKELQIRLGQRDSDLNKKNQDLKDLAAVIEHLRQLNVRTVEQCEKEKLKSHSLMTRLEVTQGLVNEYQDKCSNKDLLMRTLVDIMQNIAAEFSIATLVRSMRETTVKPSFVKKGGIDFNLESLCQYLETSANELVRIKQAEEDADDDPMVAKVGCKKITPTLMPPSNFRITRRVGSDSLLVAWTPPDDTEVSGYLVNPS